MEGTFYLVDGTALAYRAHFAFIRNPLTNSKGQQTSAVFGYATTLLKILREESPDYAAVAFDRREPTFRKKRYAEYKATREKAPPELIAQLPWIKDLTEALGLPVLELAGFEADDLIGTAARVAAGEGLEVRIVSGDKDMLQIVSDHVKIYDVSKGGAPVIIGPDEVVERMGVGPERVIDVMGLMGDTSDNVPGVPLVGPKKATQLIQQYGSLEEVLRQAPAGKKSKTQQNLIDYADQARLSRELVTLDLEAPIEVPFQPLGDARRDRARLEELFTELEFTQLLKETQGESAEEASTEGYRIVTDKAGVADVVDSLRAAGFFVFDTETTSLDPYVAEMVGISFSWKACEAVYLPWSDAVAAAVKPVLEDPALPKGGQNLKYDAQVLRTNGIEVADLAFDTMLASYLLDPGRGNHNLDAMALRHLGIRKTPTEELIGKGKDQISMADVPVETVGMYAAEDADCTFRLVELFRPRLAEEGLTELFGTVEMPLVPVLIDMERAGVRIDSDFLARD